MALRLALDQYEIPRYDYGYNINFKIYDEDESAFNATGFTGTAKFYKRQGDQSNFYRDVAKAIEIAGELASVINDISVTWDTQSSGEGHFAFTSNTRPSLIGYMWVEIRLTTTTAKRSTELVRMYVSPSDAP